MQQVGLKLRSLRESIGISQARMAEIMDSTQSSINRYEHGLSTPSVGLLRKYADYFDISLDYIFGRCDTPQGKLYEAKPPVVNDSPAIKQFVEMCFDPESAINAKLKDILVRMLQEEKNETYKEKNTKK